MQKIEQKLSRIDLNLLVSLSTLLRERNVTRAAEVLHLSQPAMSRTLNRLRELFNDPLLYRQGNRLEPTVKALSLYEPLEQLLQSTEHLLSNEEFAPSQAQQVFRLAMLPLVSGPLIRILLNALSELAPGISIEDYPITTDPTIQLIDNKCDFTLHIEAPDDPDLKSVKLGTVYGVIYSHISHPLAQADHKPDFMALMDYPYVELLLTSQSGQKPIHPIDALFKNRKIEREIYLRSSQLNTLLEAMPSRNGLLVSSNLLSFAGGLEKSLYPLFRFPDTGIVQVPVYLIQHRRSWQSLSHQWFSQQTINCLTHFINMAEQQHLQSVAEQNLT